MMATTNGRTFVAEETDGKIYEIVTVGGTPRVELFFDVGTAIATNTDRQLDFTNTFHGGLRSVAFPSRLCSERVVLHSNDGDPSNGSRVIDVSQ